MVKPSATSSHPIEPDPDLPSLDSLLHMAHRQSMADLRRVIGAEGMPAEFWRVLEVLGDERGRTMSALAQQAGMQMPATSKVIDRMVDAALVQRAADPQDQRKVILYISEFGLQRIAALRDGVDAQRRRRSDHWSPKREEQLRQLLGEFIEVQRRAARALEDPIPRPGR
jgi:DNA-binding MarR family transcriptional regulator